MTLVVNGFAGPGGWCVALQQLGLHSVGLELDATACATRAAAGHLTVRADVTQYPTAPFKGRITGKVDSPVCTPFSRAGKGGGIRDLPLVHQAVHDLAHGRDTRAELRAACTDPVSILAAEPMRWHHDLRPEWIAMEQVPDVLPLWQQYAGILRGWGYSVWTGVLNAADYGVPQTRRRAILIASRARAVTAPEPTHAETAMEPGLFGPGRARWVSMAEALSWDAGGVVNTRGERKTPGGNEFAADQPSWALTEKTRSWVLHTRRGPVRSDGDRQLVDPESQPAPTVTTKTGEQWVLRNGTQKNAAVRDLDQPAGTLFFGARCNDVSWVLRNGNQPNAAVRRADEPAPTMAFGNNSARVEWVQDRPATTVCATNRIAPPGHRDRSAGGESQFASPDTVRITVAEASVLQSFPADYPWQGTKTKRFQQVGNAVPPGLARAVLAVATGLRSRDEVAA